MPVFGLAAFWRVLGILVFVGGYRGLDRAGVRCHLPDHAFYEAPLRAPPGLPIQPPQKNLLFVKLFGEREEAFDGSRFQPTLELLVARRHRPFQRERLRRETPPDIDVGE